MEPNVFSNQRKEIQRKVSLDVQHTDKIKNLTKCKEGCVEMGHSSTGGSIYW